MTKRKPLLFRLLLVAQRQNDIVAVALVSLRPSRVRDRMHCSNTRWRSAHSLCSGHSSPTSSQSSSSLGPETNADRLSDVCLAAPQQYPQTPGTAPSSHTQNTTAPAPRTTESGMIPTEIHWIYRPKSSPQYRT